MTIAWNAFTPWHAAAGDLVIGIATAIFILFNGRIAGISGILGGLLRPARGDVGWRFAFVAGFLVAPHAYAAFSALPLPEIDAGYGTLVIAGLIVGVGTRYGS